MHIVVLVLALVLLIWREPSSAQKTYTVTVSVDRSLPPLSDEDVRLIMDDASHELKKDPGGQACSLAFKLNGPVRTFGSPDKPVIIETDSQRDAVHAVDVGGKDADFHIKVVEAIYFCAAHSDRGFTGCAYPAELPSIIVAHPDKLKKQYGEGYNHVMWVHEFGHLTGLSHRDDRDVAFLMTGCSVTPNSLKVTEKECGCLLGGIHGCGKPMAKSCPPPP